MPHHLASLGSPRTRIGQATEPTPAPHAPAGRPISRRATSLAPGRSVLPGAHRPGNAHGAHRAAGAHRPAHGGVLHPVIRRHQRRATPRTAALLLAVIAVATAALLFAAGGADAALPLDREFPAQKANPAESLISLPIDDLRYDRATRCVKQPTKGAAALVRWLPKVSPRGQNWGINRCEKWGKNSASLHAEGRAIDWHLDVNNKADRADAERLIRLLLAPDSTGEPHALARRLGVQGLIWDCRAWWGGGTLHKYSVCTGKNGRWKTSVNKTLAHRDHVHIELSKPGAALKTSWWKHGAGRAIAASVR